MKKTKVTTVCGANLNSISGRETINPSSSVIITITYQKYSELCRLLNELNSSLNSFQDSTDFTLSEVREMNDLRWFLNHNLGFEKNGLHHYSPYEIPKNKIEIDKMDKVNLIASVVEGQTLCPFNLLMEDTEFRNLLKAVIDLPLEEATSQLISKANEIS